MEEDMVNHPKHYTFGTIEVIEVIEDWKLCYHLGNVIKYLARSKHKEKEIEDLRKAQWYLYRFVEQKIYQIPTKEIKVKYKFEKVIKDWKIEFDVEKVMAGIFMGNYINALSILVDYIRKIEINETGQNSE